MRGKPDRDPAATYSRVSNPDDKRERSIDSQEDANVALAEERGFFVPEEYRFRERHTGMESIYDRPVLGRIRGLASAGKIKAVVCYDTDRLARDPNELTIVVRGLHKEGASPLFVRCDQDTTTRIGEMVLYMKGFASALEWDTIRDRSMRGRQEIYDAGQWVGHGRVRYGYLWDRIARTRTAHPERAPIVVRIFELVASGMNPCDVARLLIDDGVPPPHTAPWMGTTIRSIVKEETYKGVVRGRLTRPTDIKRANGKKRQARRPLDEQLSLDGQGTEPLVSEQLWNLANAMMSIAPTRTRLDMSPSADDFLFSCMVWCGKCGRKMAQARTKNRFTPTKRCRAYRCTGNVPNRRDKTGCASSLGAIRLEDDAWRKVMAFLMEPGVAEAHLAELESCRTEDTIERDLAVAEKRRKQIERQVRSIVDARQDATSKIVQKTLKEKLAELDATATMTDNQIEILKARLDGMANSQHVVASFREKLTSLRRLASGRELSYDDRRFILVSLGVRVFGYKGGCRIQIEVEEAVRHHYGNGGSGTRTDVVVSVGTVTLSD